MLSKSERLTVKEIDTLKQGKSVFGTLISLRYIPSGAPKFSVSVSSKTAPRAVDRNRMRRRVFSALEGVGARMKSPAFAMLMPKKECLAAEIGAIREEAVSLLRKAGLIS